MMLEEIKVDIISQEKKEKKMAFLETEVEQIPAFNQSLEHNTITLHCNCTVKESD